MFTDDITLHGKHAYYTKRLAPNNPEENNFMVVYDRYIDVIMVGAVIGFINGIKEEVDRDSEYKNDTARIFLNAIQNEHENINIIFRTIMLLENQKELSDEERVNRAFRDDLNRNQSDNHKNNQNLFLSYARGGISYLYEKIVQDAVTQDDIIENINEFVEDFYEEIIIDKYGDGDIDYDSEI